MQLNGLFAWQNRYIVQYAQQDQTSGATTTAVL